MNKKLFIFCLFFLVVGCSLPKKYCRKEPIVYHVFDSLENYLCTQIPKGENISVLITKCSGCDMFIPGLSTASFEIGIINQEYKDKWVLDRHKKIMERSNRFISICGNLYPVFIIGVDDYFTDPIDSLRRYYYSIYGRQSRFDGYFKSIIVDLDKSVFYEYYSKKYERGKPVIKK